MSPNHLHRFGFEPLPELPFLLTFIDHKKNKENKRRSSRKRRSTATRHIFRTHSQKLMIANYMATPFGPNDGNDIISDDEEDIKVVDEEKDDDEYLLEADRSNDMRDDADGVNEGRKVNYIWVDHNPKNCIFRRDIFKTLNYKEALTDMLEWGNSHTMEKEKKASHAPGSAIDLPKEKFINGCNNVESLVLDPLPRELEEIFCKISDNKKKSKMISFEIIFKIFPNLTDLFLTTTTFKPKECYKFIDFAQKYEKDKLLKLERMFFF